jgi:hypothetical protein
MTRQAKRPGGGELDFGLLSPCSMDAGWYERYWYGDNSPSRLGILLDAVFRLFREAPRIGSTALAFRRNAVSFLNHGRATIAAQQTWEAAGD